MKIIDNKKDYYDYLASIYGIDELVVYDRRGSVTLNSDKVLLHGMEYYFSNRILFQDKPLSDKQYWNLRSIAKQRRAKGAKYWRWSQDERWQEIKSSLTHRVENPILTGTIIPKIIPPTEIWQSIYEYLSLLRDKPFIDTRSDVQKLESAGFDRKTSFRNVK